MDSLLGKVALVTGSSRGIGREIALALAEAGVDVAVNYLHRAEEAAAVSALVQERGRRSVALQADVSSSAEIASLIAAVERELGPIEILVNNAGISRPQPVEEITEQDWDQIVDANLKSCFLVTQAVLPGMRARHWGRVINLASVAAHVGGVVGPHYAASKAGMIGLTHYYARYFAQDGITVNAISPALIETEMTGTNPRATPSLIPVGRFGKVDEVASLVVLLAQNGYIHGQTIHVNGGMYLT